MRFETEGRPVRTDESVVMKHAASGIHGLLSAVVSGADSGSFLASDKIKQLNTFGAENEVHAHCYYSTNKTHNMISEKRGML